MKLRIKIPLIYAVLIASLGVVFIIFTSRMVEDRMVEEEQEYFKSLTNALALNSANAIVVKDYALDRARINTWEMNVTFIDVTETDLVFKHMAGIRAAKGSFIAFMDDDDLFASLKIERILE